MEEKEKDIRDTHKRMIKIKLIKVITEKSEAGNKFNEIKEFDTIQKFDNWRKYNKMRGKLNWKKLSMLTSMISPSSI